MTSSSRFLSLDRTEAETAGRVLRLAAGGVDQRDVELVEVRGLGGPEQRALDGLGLDEPVAVVLVAHVVGERDVEVQRRGEEGRAVGGVGVGAEFPALLGLAAEKSAFKSSLSSAEPSALGVPVTKTSAMETAPGEWR